VTWPVKEIRAGSAQELNLSALQVVSNVRHWIKQIAALNLLSGVREVFEVAPMQS